MAAEIGAAAHKAAGKPLVIGAGFSQPLEKLGLDKTHYNEDWLQQLAFDHPEVLPIGDIEPGIGAIYAVAREVPCGHGYIDNLYITPTGDIVLVEAKLWRNHQARREVVAQALDYVAALMGMGFEAFEAACRKGKDMAGPSLYDLIAQEADALPEQDFIDAVTRNLARGRMLVVALGDGIRTEAEALAGLLQSHAGAHFTFALVELAIWRNAASGDLVVLPSTLARTVMITRGIVTVEDGKAVVRPVPANAQTHAGSISEEKFYEGLASLDPTLPAAIRALISQLEPLGVYPDLKAALSFKADLPECERPVNFGYIAKNGRTWTDTLAATIGTDLATDYAKTLADLIGGSVGHMSGGQVYLTDGKTAPLITQLLPKHGGQWADAIAGVIAKLRGDAEPAPDPAPAPGSPFEQSYLSGVPLVGIVFDEPRSPVLGFIRTETGFAWVDDGIMQDFCPGNPVHLIEGPVEESESRIRCGHTLLRPIAESEDEIMAYWAQYLRAFGSLEAMHAKAEGLLRQAFFTAE